MYAKQRGTGNAPQLQATRVVLLAMSGYDVTIRLSFCLASSNSRFQQRHEQIASLQSQTAVDDFAIRFVRDVVCDDCGLRFLFL